MAIRHLARVHARARRLLAAPLRLAQGRGRVQRAAAVQDVDRRRRRPFHPRPRPRGPNAMPLLLSHGWPGSILEFVKIIPLLARRLHARRAVAAGVHAIVRARAAPMRAGRDRQRRSTRLMTRLGYARYGAQGGDWGSFVTAWLGANRPASISPASISTCCRCAAMPRCSTNRPRTSAATSASSTTWLQGRNRLPVDPGHAAADARVRPVRLSRGSRGVDHREVSRVDRLRRRSAQCAHMDEMLGDISLYWFTNCIGASFWPYYARMHGPWPIDGRHRRADGVLRISARDPAPAAPGGATRVRRYPAVDVMPKGGHFAALEQPAALAHEIRAFFANCAMTVDMTLPPLPISLRSTRLGGVRHRSAGDAGMARRAGGSRASRGHDRALALLRMLEEQAQQRGIVANVPPYLRLSEHDSRGAAKAPTPAISRSRSA